MNTVYLKHFKANHKGRDFIIGDLHGRLDLLIQEKDKLAFDKQVDRLFSVGDLIDRGMQSKACFKLLTQPWFHAARGNHEQMMFDWLSNPNPTNESLWLQNGGSVWAEDPDALFSTDHSFKELVLLQRSQMPFALEIELLDGRRIGIIHATSPVRDWDVLEESLERVEVTRRKALWEIHANEIIHPAPVKNIDLTVHGHTMVRGPKRRGNAVYVDTGACLTGERISDCYINNPRLSMLRLESLFEIEDDE